MVKQYLIVYLIHTFIIYIQKYCNLINNNKFKNSDLLKVNNNSYN